MTVLSATRTTNRSAVLAALISAGELDRPRLATTTGLSQATIFRVVDRLLEDGLVIEGDAIERSGAGRAATRIRFDAGAACVAAIDLGGTNCRIVLSDALGRTIGRRHDITPVSLPAAELADWLIGNVFDLVARHGAGMPLGALAIGLPGAVAGDKERVVGSVNLPQIIGTEFIDAVVEASGVPVAFDNDSNLALLGELRYGRIPASEPVALLVLGTGLSGAIAMGSEVLVGREGHLGEFGRLRLPQSDFRLRDLLSGAGLVRYAGAHAHPVRTAHELFANPAQHAEMLAEVDRALLHLVSTVALAYEPHCVVVTGGFSGAFDDDALRSIAARVEEDVRVQLTLERSHLGESAGLLGAMSHALSSLYLELGVSASDILTITSDGDAITREFDARAPKETLDSFRL